MPHITCVTWTPSSVLLDRNYFSGYWLIIRRDSMISILRMGPAIGGRGLCDRVIFRHTKSCVRKLGSPFIMEIYRQLKGFRLKIGIFTPCQDSLLFDTWFSNSEYYLIHITESTSADCLTNTKCKKHGVSPTHNLSFIKIVIFYLKYFTADQLIKLINFPASLNR